MRIGDYIDDYCSRCQRGTDHNVVSVEGDEAKKVRCRTCDYEHNYRKNRSGKKEMTNQEAFAKVLASVMPGMGAMPEAPKKKGRKKS